MRTGDNFVKDVNVFINYMLTKERSELAKKVRAAKTAKKINKYFIDQNGRIKVKKTGDAEKNYHEVKSEDDLNHLIN